MNPAKGIVFKAVRLYPYTIGTKKACRRRFVRADSCRVSNDRTRNRKGGIYMNSTIDLHTHSCYSADGELTPAELIRRGAARGVRIMAISDHNCVRGNAEGEQAARAAGIVYIPGVEIDCTFNGINLHVLGYGIDAASPDFAALETDIVRSSAASSQERLEATRKLGFTIDESEMAAVAGNSYWKDIWTGEMFAEVLLNKPEYRDHPVLAPYRAGGPRGDNPYVNFYWDYYGQDKPCYVEIRFPTLASAIGTIRTNGGKAVLAHPGVNLKDRGEEVLDAIANAGIDGIEAFSSYHSAEQALYFYRKARDHGLFVTCGSDFHGKTKPIIGLGQHGAPVTDETIEANLAALLERAGV